MGSLQKRWLSGCLLLLYVVLHVGGTALHALPGCAHGHSGAVCEPQAATKLASKAVCACHFHQRAAERNVPVDGWRAGQDDSSSEHVCPLCQHLALTHWHAPDIAVGRESRLVATVVSAVLGCHSSLPFGVKLPRGPPVA